MGADLFHMSRQFEADQADKIKTAAEQLLALEPDLRSLLADHKADTSGRGRCFLDALDNLRAEVERPMIE